MPVNEQERRDPLAGLGSGEPEEELGLTSLPAALARPSQPGGRKTPVRPSERRRRARQLTVTFSDEEIPERLRRLAGRWGMVAPDGRQPHTSAVVEHLVMPRLEAAERGEVGPPAGPE